MELIFLLPIRSSGLLLLTKVKKGRLHLIAALNKRIAKLVSRCKRGQLLALVDLYQLQQALLALEQSLKQREKDYQALLQTQSIIANEVNYKILQKLPCRIGTPVHSLWLSCLQSMDNVFCAINTLAVMHGSEHRKKATVLLHSLRQECVRYVLKLLYLPNRAGILIDEFLALSIAEQKAMLEANKVTVEQLKDVIDANEILEISEGQKNKLYNAINFLVN